MLRQEANVHPGQPEDRRAEDAIDAPTTIMGAGKGVGRHAYVVCSTPRTGSSLLCEALKGTGLAGRPDEYFDVHEENVAHWTRALGVTSPDLYLDQVLAAGSTTNGVFGLKLHWHQMPAVPQLAGGEAAGPDVDAVLGERFARRSYIWLRRRNKIAQAISYLRASRSAVWRIEQGGTASEEGDLAFDAAEIERHVDLVTRFDQQWEAWFRRKRLSALVLIYEDFCKSYEATVQGVCRHIGIGGKTLQIAPPRYVRQADARSLEWEAEYRRLKSLAAQPARSPTAPMRAGEATDDREAPKLIAYDLGSRQGVRLAPAPGRRAWMDAMPHRAATRCLPMVIANQQGWLMLAPFRIEAIWDGSEGREGVTISPPPEGHPAVATSHFGSGILTFSAEYLFRTPSGINLHVRGPANCPKDGISALEGIVETDWAEATFTMNWKFTRPHQPVVFEVGEPFAMLVPVWRGDIEAFEPLILPIAADPALAADTRAWAASRARFNADLQNHVPEALGAGWQRHYVRGETIKRVPAGSHQTKLTLKNFDDRRVGRPPVPL